MRSTTRTAHTPRSAARASHRGTVSRRERRPRPVALVVEVPVRMPAERPVSRKGLHLTRRGRLVVLLALVALLLAAFSLGRVGIEAATAAVAGPTLVETTVQPGESLWTVARRIAPASDPREVVQQLRRINHLSGSGLQAGQQLLLPA